MFKNTASKFTIFAFDATTNVPKTGDAANITAYVSIDNGAVTVLADTSATEMDATNAPGYYLFDAAQGETNGDKLLVSGKSSTANIKIIGAPAVIFTRPTTGWLAPTTAGRTLDVSAGGEAGVDWSNVGSPTTALALTGTTIATTQKVDVDTIKTNPVVNGGTITFPTNSTLASTTNITGGVITTVTTVTNQLTAAAIATGIWQDTTAGDFTTAASIGKSIMNGVALGTGLTINAYTGNTVQTGDSFARIGAAGVSLTAVGLTGTQTFNNTGTWTGNITGNLSGSVGSVTGAVGSVTGAVGSVTGLTASDVGAIKTQTDKMTFTVANVIDANMLRTNGDATAAANVAKTTRAIGRGTASGVPTTTSIPTSAFTPVGVDADQFKGRIITFDADTVTTNLRGQSTDITANTAAAAPVFTVTALTVAPAVGDTFSVT